MYHQRKRTRALPLMGKLQGNAAARLYLARIELGLHGELEIATSKRILSKEGKNHQTSARPAGPILTPRPCPKCKSDSSGLLYQLLGGCTDAREQYETYLKALGNDAYEEYCADRRRVVGCGLWNVSIDNIADDMDRLNLSEWDMCQDMAESATNVNGDDEYDAIMSDDNEDILVVNIN